jgi:soluble lytic murein transglycosylase
MFQSRAGSSAGAMGLMQLMPATGKEMAENLNWPPDFSNSDLWRPDVNITLGTRYLMNQRDYLGGNIAASLAAYNAGPGNAQKWLELSNGDMDLFLEIIRFEETRNYLMQIGEFLNIYNMIYQLSPG